KAEMYMWSRIIAVSEELSAQALFSKCDQEVFPVVHRMLRILLALPVSVATAERSFSALRRLKTWLRNRMVEERLVGLALLHVHRDILIDVEELIDQFAFKKSRRLEFVL